MNTKYQWMNSDLSLYHTRWFTDHDFHMTTYENRIPYIVWKTKYLIKVTSSWVAHAIFHRFWLITLLIEYISFIKSSKVFNTYNAVYQIQGFCCEYSFTGSLKRKKNCKSVTKLPLKHEFHKLWSKWKFKTNFTSFPNKTGNTVYYWITLSVCLKTVYSLRRLSCL